MGQDRNKKRVAPFVMVIKDMLRSPAWLALTNAGRIAWLHLAADYNGRNDGHLKLTYGQAEQIMDRKTFKGALEDLKGKGFITLTKPGGLMGGAAEYALSNAWRTWQPPAKTKGKKVQGGKSTPGKGDNPPRQGSPRQLTGVEMHHGTAH